MEISPQLRQLAPHLFAFVPARPRAEPHETKRAAIRALGEVPMPVPDELMSNANVGRHVAMVAARATSERKAGDGKPRKERARNRLIGRPLPVYDPSADPLAKRVCRNPACGKLLVRKPGEKSDKWRRRGTCDYECANAAMSADKLRVTARTCGCLREMEREPERRWLASELAGPAGVSAAMAGDRLKRYGKAGWVGHRHTGRHHAHLWWLTEAGLEAVRAARA